jgi:hypothetical protein
MEKLALCSIVPPPLYLQKATAHAVPYSQKNSRPPAKPEDGFTLQTIPQMKFQTTKQLSAAIIMTSASFSN